MVANAYIASEQSPFSVETDHVRCQNSVCIDLGYGISSFLVGSLNQGYQLIYCIPANSHAF